MPLSKCQKTTGFTLFELLATIAILALLAVFSIPQFGKIIAKYKMQSTIAEWRSVFYLAQREAIRRKHQIRLCGSSDGQSCDQKNDWNQGWIILDVNDKQLIQDFPLPYKNQFYIKLRIGNGVPLQFMNNGRLVSQFAGASFEVTHRRYAEVSATLKISRAGRIRQVLH